MKVAIPLIALLASGEQFSVAQEPAVEVLRQPVKSSNSSLYPSWRIPDITHAALGLHPKEAFQPTTLDKADLKKLCHMHDHEVSSNVWEAAFFTAEQDATMALANRLKGKTKQQIQKMLGKTCFVGIVPSFMKNTRDADQQWTYFVGGNKFPLVLLFRNSECIETQTPNDLDFSSNDIWGTSMIVGEVGMTYAQIRRLNGPPETEYFQPGDTTHKHCPIRIFYDFGKTHGVCFSFEKGRCVERFSGIFCH